MTDSTNKHSDSKTIFEFRAYLDEWERRCNDKIKRAEEDKDESGKIRLAAFIGMQGSHEQLRDIETVRSVLQSFDTYIG